MTRFICTAAVFFLSSAPLLGQGQPSLKQRPGVLTVEDVVALVEADIGEDVVIEKVRQNATAFDLSVDQLLRLKEAGVSSEIIKTMINPAIGTGSSSSSGTATAEERDPRWPADIPNELGVYTKFDGRTSYIEPEVVTWKARGKLMAIATRGLGGNHQNGVVNGPRSRNQVSMPLEVFIVVEEGTSANEYRCVSMRSKANQREFRFETSGAINAGSADKNLIEFHAERISARLYRIELTELKRGEYGFIPPGAALGGVRGAAGRIYSFGVE